MRAEVAALLVPAVAVLLLGSGALWWHRAELDAVVRGNPLIDPERIVAPFLERRGRPVPPGSVRGVLLGDSVIGPLPTRIVSDLESRGIDVDLVTLAYPGLAPVHFLFLIDEVLRAEPGFALVEVDLLMVNPLPGGFLGARFDRLARFLDAARAWRMRAPLAAGGFAALDALLFRAEDAIGLGYAVEGVRESGRQVLDGAARAAQERLGLVQRAPGAPHRRRTVEAYRRELIGTPAVEFLREVLGALRASAVPTVLFVTPVNRDRLAQLGVDLPADLQARLESLRVAVGAAPGEWLDLADALDRTGFTDELGHLLASGADRVAALLSGAVAARIVSAPPSAASLESAPVAP